MKRHHIQIARFLLVGSATVGIDFIAYRLLLVFAVPIDIAKLGGFLTGTLVAYFANRLWTFAHDHAPARGSAKVVGMFMVVYLFGLGTNVYVNHAVLVLLKHRETAIIAAFIVATGVSATLNFLGMKFLVFRA